MLAITIILSAILFIFVLFGLLYNEVDKHIIWMVGLLMWFCVTGTFVGVITPNKTEETWKTLDYVSTTQITKAIIKPDGSFLCFSYNNELPAASDTDSKQILYELLQCPEMYKEYQTTGHIKNLVYTVKAYSGHGLPYQWGRYQILPEPPAEKK